MAQIIWTTGALKDLDQTAQFIASDSEAFAKITVQKIYSRVSQLKDFPNSGRIVPEFDDPNLREVIEGNYRIIYENGASLVFILAVRHSARRLSFPRGD